jgi:hypothetical protein
MAKKKVALTKEDKFRQCPKCFGPIDYFNTCRSCGRPWTPALSTAEKLEMEAEARGEESEEPEPVLVGERESALEREKEEIVGKKAKPVGTKKHTSPIFKHWEINDGDDDTEIVRKRSLMRLDSRRIYAAMGLSTKAYGNLKNVMVLLTRLWEHLDDKEREAFAPTAEFLKKGLLGLAELTSKKVNLAAQMEETLTREYHRAHQVRQARTTAQIVAKKATRVTTPGADTEGFETVNLVNLNPEELMEQIQTNLKLKGLRGQKHEESEFSDEE